MKKAKTAQKAKKQKKPQTLAGKIIKTVLSGIAALVIIFSLFSLDGVISPYKRMISSLAGGYKQSWDNSKVDATGLDLEYNKPDFSKNDIASAESALSKQISDEGTVLLKNDGLMPFNPGTKFSFFGSSSFGSTSLLTSVLGGEGADLKTAFESAGLAVNDQLLEFYQKGAGSKYNLGAGSIGFGANEDFAINECPLSVVLSEEGLAESFKGTVPVYVMKRIAGEGRDAPRSMYNHTLVKEDQALNYFEPNSTEREILKHLNDNYPGIVLVVNSNYALPLGWVSEYENIKAVLFAPSMNSLGDIFAGNANPSGRTVDTFAANLLDSPAAQNYGDYAYLNPDGTQTKYNYVTYQEGIYVGYKYYETRYEDIVLDQGNPGDFKYDDEVVYPFGFGLSYTDFEWSGFSVSNPNNNNEDFLVSLEVKNTGAVAGKDVVEIYAQSPYTDYDRENGVEKPAVSLVAFAKTSNLLPGESETVTASFRREQLKSYDSKNAKTFILEPGTYYITAGKDAHSAVNNILASKGKTVSGNSDLVAAYEPGLTEIDMTYSRDSFSGAEITNLFDEAAGDAKYLSRNDWIGTFPSHDGQVTSIISTWGNEINGTDSGGNPASFLYGKEATADLLQDLDSFDSRSPIDPASFSDSIVYGVKNGVQLIELRGLDYNDPLWEKLLDELSAEDYYNVVGISGYGTAPIKSIGKPFGTDADTAAGLIYGGTGQMYPSPVVLAMTWNADIALRYGEMIGTEAILGGADGWYAPSMNIHRTPFSGRNGEYYSEDGYLSGAFASLETKGAASKGMYAYVKHFAFNDQENHRGDGTGQFSLVTWLNEQSIRELYLVPFEMCMKAGDVDLNFLQKSSDGKLTNATRSIRACSAVMTAFNRVGSTWTGGSYPLITGILRNEWAFDGFVITDNANTGVYMDGYQMIEAGADAKLTSASESARFDFDKDNPAHYHYAREAIHHVLYTIANSKAMIGAMPGSVYKAGVQIIDIIQGALYAVLSGLLALVCTFAVRRFMPKRQAVLTLPRQAK